MAVAAFKALALEGLDFGRVSLLERLVYLAAALEGSRVDQDGLRLLEALVVIVVVPEERERPLLDLLKPLFVGPGVAGDVIPCPHPLQA
jgi:hypothetical protein